MPTRSQSRKGKVYRFVHRQDEYIKTNITGYEFASKNGFVTLSKDGLLRINGSRKNGYAWDGCTPKIQFLDLVFGVPDGKLDFYTEKPITYYASMVHDVLYQFKDEIPISRWSSDFMFYKILQQACFFWSLLYFISVRTFGWFFGRWKSKEKKRDLEIIECSWIVRAHNFYNSMKEKPSINSTIIETAMKYEVDN